jgi:hypothetical protein
MKPTPTPLADAPDAPPPQFTAGASLDAGESR